MIAISRLFATVLLASAASLPLLPAVSAAEAAPMLVSLNQSFASSPITFGYGGSTFTFTGTGDIFAPTAVSGTGQFNTIFGSPTSYFTNRGTVTFGPSMQYASFSTPTTISFSNGDNFIGLAATIAGSTYYGFAYTTNTVLNGFGFETTANTPITATTALAGAVPEPAGWAMMIVGFGAIGAAMRQRNAVVRFA